MKLIALKLAGVIGILGASRLVTMIPWLRKHKARAIDSYPDLSDEQLKRIHSRFDAAGWDDVEAEQPCQDKAMVS